MTPRSSFRPSLSFVIVALAGLPLGAQRGIVAMSRTESVRAAWEPVVAAANRSVARVRVGDEVVAFATVVDRSGLLVTKASLLADDAAPVVVLGGADLPAQVAARDPATDLALLAVATRSDVGTADAKTPEFVAVEFAGGDPSAGTFVATPGGDRLPLGTGILSAAPYLHSRQRGYLGVQLQMDDGPVRLRSVQDGTAAAAVGLQADDVIAAVDDAAMQSRDDLLRTLGAHRPGDHVRLKVRRGDADLMIDVRLGADSRGPESPQERIWGPLSTVRAGFAFVLQHDTVLRPEQMGGPLIGLDGRALGVNIARAGRVETLALPGDAVTAAVTRMRAAVAAPQPAERDR